MGWNLLGAMVFATVAVMGAYIVCTQIQSEGGELISVALSSVTDTVVPVTRETPESAASEISGNSENTTLAQVVVKGDVLERVGAPRQIDAASSKWTYDDRVVFFHGDRVIGSVESNRKMVRQAPVMLTPKKTRTPKRPTLVRAHHSAGYSQVIYGHEVNRSGNGPRIYTSTRSGSNGSFRSRRYRNRF